MKFDSSLQKVVVLQPENPDGDSIASALALEEILSDAGFEVALYSYVHIPDYLHYIEGWDRIINELPSTFDMSIIVDTVTHSLLERTLKTRSASQIKSKPVLILDHHPVATDLPLPHAEYYTQQNPVVSTGELVVALADDHGWTINPRAATHVVESILADSLGLTTQNTAAETVEVVARMMRLGASLSTIDERRRALTQKSPTLIKYKGELLQRIVYMYDDAYAYVHIPWEEIQTYSPLYNPTMLALEELRNASGVLVAVGLKSYPDGKITAKIRTKIPVANDLAGHFGGGGHQFAAGFKTYDWSLEAITRELSDLVKKVLDHQSTIDNHPKA